jgi:hypothetical protein
MDFKNKNYAEKKAASLGCFFTFEIADSSSLKAEI